MVLQGAQTGAVSGDPSARQWSRRAVGAYLVTILVATAVLAGVVEVRRHHVDRVLPPKPVLGSALVPLPLYSIVYGSSTHAGPGEISVPESDRPGHRVILRSTAVSELDVEYARVRPLGGQHWFLTVVAREPGGAGSFSKTPVLGGVIDGREFRVGDVDGTPDATNFEIVSESAYGMTEGEAVALARSLTTSVTVAQCSSGEIAANECT